MQISGTNDNIVPIDGYPEDAFDYEEWGGAPDIYTIFDFWSNLEGCLNSNTITVLFDYPTDITYYTDCVNNNELRLYIVNGMGHSWPNFSSEEIWDFFMQVTSPLGVNEEDSNNELMNTLDILGRKTNNNKGFQLQIYDDGSVHKKYLIK